MVGSYGAMTGANTAADDEDRDEDEPHERRAVAQQTAQRVAPQAPARAGRGAHEQRLPLDRPSQLYLIRGFRNAYPMSTRRFTARKMIAKIRMRDWTTM